MGRNGRRSIALVFSLGFPKAPCQRTFVRIRHERLVYLRLFESDTMHSTSSRRQFVHGVPFSTTLQRTLRDLQHWQALAALLFTER